MYSSKLSKRQIVSDMEYFMYPSMFRQLNVYNIVEEPGRFYLPDILELSAFICMLLILWDIISLTKSLPENIKFVNSWDLVPRL